MVRMTEEKRKLFDKMERWQNIANGCEHAREHEIISIPTLLPKCVLTGEACRYEYCPKTKSGEVAQSGRALGSCPRG